MKTGMAVAGAGRETKPHAAFKKKPPLEMAAKKNSLGKRHPPKCGNSEDYLTIIVIAAYLGGARFPSDAPISKGGFFLNAARGFVSLPAPATAIPVFIAFHFWVLGSDALGVAFFLCGVPHRLSLPAHAPALPGLHRFSFLVG